MNMFTSSKKTKKFVLALIVLVLFSFCYPKNVNAGILEDLEGGIAKLVWSIEKGIMKWLNNIFTDENHPFQEVTIDGKETVHFYLTPDNIIKGKFVLFDANIFRDITEKNADAFVDMGNDGVKNGKVQLRETISGWYYALRNLAIVALLSVLVYVGIRMIMSTVAQDKAKYKIMFKDWLIALCLLIIMHYIMIGILNITSMITTAIGGDSTSVQLFDNLIGDIKDVLGNKKWDQLSEIWPKLLVLGGIIAYSFIFAVKYLKREFTIVFLILLGPVSCITYPIDKISDGKAQAFNKWFSEFLYQVIIQPFHLLLYIVLVGSAAELAETNVLYVLICFAMIIPAEKFIKEMFGFKDKLGSPLGAFAGGAIASKAISSLFNGGKGSGSSGKGGVASDDGVSNNLPPKTVDKDAMLGVEGEQEGNGQINQKDSPALEEGQPDSGNTISGDSPVQQTDNPVLEGEGNSSEGNLPVGDGNMEPVDANALAVGTQAAAATEAANQNGETGKDVDAQLNADEAYKRSRLLGRLLNIHNARASQKWGSTNRGRRWVNRGKAVAKGIAKTGVRMAGLGAGALVGGALGMMVGKGAAGAGAGLALGGSLSNKVIKGASGVVKTAKDYSGAFGQGIRTSQAKQAFKADKVQQNMAIKNFQKNHKTTELPTAKQLDQEMNDRFELSTYGLSNDQIDKAVGAYQELRDDKVKPGMSSEQERQAIQAALNETVFATKLSDDYSKKDFRDTKVMGNAVTTISAEFQSYGVKDANVANQKAVQYLKLAAKIKGSEIAIPNTQRVIESKQTVEVAASSKTTPNTNTAAQVNRTVEVQVDLETQVIRALGLDENRISENEKIKINSITYNLKDYGGQQEQIINLASSCKGGNVDEVTKKFNKAFDYTMRKDAATAAMSALTKEGMSFEVDNNGKYSEESFQAIYKETLERARIKQDLGSETDISAIRKIERINNIPDLARKFATDNKGFFEDENKMKIAKDDLVKKFEGVGVSRYLAEKRADDIIKFAKEKFN